MCKVTNGKKVVEMNPQAGHVDNRSDEEVKACAENRKNVFFMAETTQTGTDCFNGNLFSTELDESSGLANLSENQDDSDDKQTFLVQAGLFGLFCESTKDDVNTNFGLGYSVFSINDLDSQHDVNSQL